jgi:hypothetical protein
MCGRCQSANVEAVVTCDDSPIATRCNACGAVEVTMVMKATVFKTCAYKPCSKRFEAPTDRYGTNRLYCNGSCRIKSYDRTRVRTKNKMKSYFVEVWRVRQGELSGIVAINRLNDPDHSFFVSATDSEQAKTEIAKSPYVKKGDTYRMKQVMEEPKNKTGGMIVTGKVK